MWLEDSKRRLFFDMHFPDWEDREIAQNFKPKELACRFAKSNIDSVILYAKCQYGNFYYNTELGHKHSGLGDQDLFVELRDELHERDIKVIAYYSVSWDEYVAKNHPEYLTVTSDGSKENTDFRWKTLCINTAYREMVKAHIEEITKVCKPDGYWIDMTIIGENRCYCEACQKKYSILHKESMPLPGETNYNKAVQFRYDYIEDFYKELRQVIYEINPEIQVSNNYWGYPYSNASMGSRAIGATKSCDYVTGEAYTDWTGLNAPSFFTKFLRGIAGGRPYEALIGRFYNTWDYTRKPEVQLAFEAYTTVANGACVTLDDEPFSDGSIDDHVYDSLERVFGEVKKRQHVLGKKNIPYAGIFHSQLTKDCCDDKSVFIRSIAGSFKMFRDLHIPLDFIFDENIEEENLRQYRCIVLPSVAYIEEKHMCLLVDYVKQGGILICSGMTPLLENSKESALYTGFGISGQREEQYSLSYGKYKDHLLMAKGNYTLYDSDNQGIGQLVEPICETSKERFFHNNLPAPYKATEHPLVIEKSYGSGKVLCFAQPVFNHYAKQSQWDLREMFKELLDKVVGEPEIMFTMPHKADMAVSKEGSRYIIHILNPNPALSVCCGYMDPFEGAYPRTLEYMDEVVPLHNIEICIKGKKIKAIETFEAPDNYKIIGESTVAIPVLNLWETLVIETEE